MTSPAAASALDGGKLAFLATAATVIPVFLLGYLIGTARVARRLAELADERAQLRLKDEPLLLAFDWFGGGQERRRRIIAPAMLVVAALPVCGEICALAVLAGDHWNPTLAVFVWIGVAASMMVALAPVIYEAGVMLDVAQIGWRWQYARLVTRLERDQKGDPHDPAAP